MKNIIIIILIGFISAYCNRPNKLTDQDGTNWDTLAYLCKGNFINEINAINSENFLKLPDTLIIEPGIYKVWDKIFDLTKECTYRFLIIGKENIQRIVYKNNTEQLLSSISWICSHGLKDNRKNYDYWYKNAKSRKLYLICGGIQKFSIDILKKSNEIIINNKL